MKAAVIPSEILSSVTHVYADGGVHKINPSPSGGSWAFVYARKSVGVSNHLVTIHEDSGIVQPGDIGLPTVSNNVTELIAMLLALEPLPDFWNGEVFTDSLITLRRFDSMSAKMNGVPDDIVQRVRDVVGRMKYRLTLLAGHPTAADLERGFQIKKSGSTYPVSPFNVRCDELCGEAINRKWPDVSGRQLCDDLPGSY